MDKPELIGSRRELFVDDFLAGITTGAALRLHTPVPRGAVLETDAPWEGNMCGYITVLRDDDCCRMYYRGWEVDLGSPESTGNQLHTPRPRCHCMAESDDGIHWRRPELGLYEYGGSRDNNIVWMGGDYEPQRGFHGFSPFLDGNPDCPPEQRYKAVGGAGGWPVPGLDGLVSANGCSWELVRDEPLITKGALDSQNLAFWDALRGEYRAYTRDFRDGRRDIRTATSPDFLNWGEPAWLSYPGATPVQLYTNNVQPYYRAPHIYVGMPARYVERPWSPSIDALSEYEHRRLRGDVLERYGAALTDAVFMSSRDGSVFRLWDEAFIRPGLRAVDNWAYGDNYPAWGMLETAADSPGGGRELSLYTTEGSWRGNSTTFRRHTLRIDGFVSLHAPLSGGELVTRPLQISGQRLSLNVSTSAAGRVRVEIQNADGKAAEGYALDDCCEVIGDTLDHTVQWGEKQALGSVADQPLRLRFELQDADLYSFQFCD